MPVAASLSAAVLPMTFYLVLIWKMDKYEPEPIKFVLVHFFWGALGAILLSVVGSALLGIATGINGTSETDSTIQTIFFAPFIEEIAKGLLLFWTVNSRKFDNITDGIVYGTAIGLGFGMTENFLYFTAYGDTASSWFYLVIVRSLFSAIMHAISTGTFGAALGISKYSNIFVRIFFPILALIFSMFIHFLWNSSVIFDGTYIYGFIFMIILFFIFLSVIKFSIYNEKKIIEKELEEEVEIGIIPHDYLPILSTRLRLRKGWMDEQTRKIYFRTAIHLAFSKMKFRKVNNSGKSYYQNEIDRNRMILRNIIKEASNV
ncbi:MAG: PrsW family intramembrane metalloprotease [Melioribacteraceae bacterium]